MRAMIFAAGLGTRLKPFTLEHPKALVPVGGEPMLKRVILKLKDMGISEMVVNVHHFASQIVDYLSACDSFGVTIHISDESDLLLDTGGGILAARRWLGVDDEPFIVHNADILTDFPLMAMAENFIDSEHVAELAVSLRKTSRYLLFDSAMRMCGWTNIQSGEVRPKDLSIEGLTPLAFGGMHVLSPRIFESLAEYRQLHTPFSITDFYIDNCDKLDIHGFCTDEPYQWHDIGKPESLATAEKAL